MGSLHQICLKWNNHQSNFSAVFNKLLNSKDFVDVTLACEGQTIKAHKIVLSACSPYFHSLFLDNPCKHPIVILKDVRLEDLKGIVEYMYKGEVSIHKDQLSELLRTAQALQIKGLYPDDSDNVTPHPAVQSQENESYFQNENSQILNNSQHNPEYINDSFSPKTGAQKQTISTKQSDSNCLKTGQASSEGFTKPIQHTADATPPAKMPRLSSTIKKEKTAAGSVPRKEAEITPIMCDFIDPQETMQIVSEPDYIDEMDEESEDDALSVSITEEDNEFVLKCEAESPDEDETFGINSKHGLNQSLDSSARLSDASVSRDLNLVTTSQEQLVQHSSFLPASPSKVFVQPQVNQHLVPPGIRSWGRKDLQTAITELQSGRLTVAQASKVFNISKTTLYFHLSRSRYDET